MKKCARYLESIHDETTLAIFGVAFVIYSWILSADKFAMSHAYFMYVHIYMPCDKAIPILSIVS